ncbi:cytochrome o ubiquinol oxidase subunit IV [Candidatus Saccharibacteria bacterium]|nr:cytochrome o ubiquinol oxidase subunit IV [Candidatus Saccharibacteria bacterium]
MSKTLQSPPAIEDETKVSAGKYVVGFIMSLALTLAAYFLVTGQADGGRSLSYWGLVFILSGLAVCQLLVQLVYFLHLGREARPRWNLMAFFFAVVVVVIVVIGSIWIMGHLNYNMMPHEMDDYMRKQNDRGF